MAELPREGGVGMHEFIDCPGNTYRPISCDEGITIDAVIEIIENAKTSADNETVAAKEDGYVE